MQPRKAWIVRALVESVLITFSILLALAVDSWAEHRDDRELAAQSLAIFEREIRQNLARVADVAPYHRGLSAVVSEMVQDPGRVAELRNVLEGVEPPVLLNTAWETALAVGALTHMDFELVSALSLTYSIQEEFRERSRVRPGPSTGEAGGPQLARDALAYITELQRAEEELHGVYTQALAIIGERSGSDGLDRPEPPREPGTGGYYP